MPKPKTPPKPKFDLNKKVGPLPLWGWGAIVVGGFYVWRYMHPATPASTGATDTGGTLAPVDTTLAPAPISGSGGGGFDSGGSSGGTTTDSTGTISGSIDPITGSIDPITGTIKVKVLPRHRHHKPPPKPHHGHPHRPRHPQHSHGRGAR